MGFLTKKKCEEARSFYLRKTYEDGTLLAVSRCFTKPSKANISFDAWQESHRPYNANPPSEPGCWVGRIPLQNRA